jgi:deazaflavin-dependent oxidoreductase (nitroreductase family)
MSKAEYSQPDLNLLGPEHVRRYLETDGDVGYVWNGVPTLLLTTIGRKTRQHRTTPLIFARRGDDFLVVASMGGAPQHPSWYLNLRAQPEATIQVRSEQYPVVARTASEDEKPALWKIVCDQWPNYDAYQERTKRVIPVVLLTPTPSVTGHPEAADGR